MRETTEQDIQGLLAEAAGLLTEEEVRGELSSYPYTWAEVLLPDLRRTLSKVRMFSTSTHAWVQPNLGLWLLNGLDYLGGGCFSLHSRPVGLIITREYLQEKFEAAAQEALIDHQEWLKDDPEDYRKTHQDNPDLKAHPWGDDTMVLCRAWLQISPYRVWKLHKSLLERASSIVEEGLLDLASGAEDGHDLGANLADRTHKLFQDEMKGISNRLGNRNR
jgi:hypothetical protein